MLSVVRSRSCGRKPHLIWTLLAPSTSIYRPLPRIPDETLADSPSAATGHVRPQPDTSGSPCCRHVSPPGSSVPPPSQSPLPARRGLPSLHRRPPCPAARPPPRVAAARLRRGSGRSSAPRPRPPPLRPLRAAPASSSGAPASSPTPATSGIARARSRSRAQRLTFSPSFSTKSFSAVKLLHIHRITSSHP